MNSLDATHGSTAQAGNQTQPVKRGPGRPRKDAASAAESALQTAVIKVPKLSPFRDPPRPASQPLDLAPAPKSKQPYRSRETVRQIELTALRKVRHALYERGLDLGDLI